MEEFINVVMAIKEPKIMIELCAIFIIGDIVTGYIKAFKFKKINSSISRDGYIKKIGWSVAILIGFLIYALAKVNLFLFTTFIVCLGTEGISVYENLGEIGLSKLPFKKYFEKLSDERKDDK